MSHYGEHNVAISECYSQKEAKFWVSKSIDESIILTVNCNNHNIAPFRTSTSSNNIIQFLHFNKHTNVTLPPFLNMIAI